MCWGIKKAVVSSTVLLASCSTIPPVTVDYYLPQAQTAVTVTESVDCTPDKKNPRLVSVFSISSSTAYSSDFERKAPGIPLDALKSAFADASATFTFTDDGRLKGINSASTGQGQAIVQAAVTMISAVGALGVAAGTPPPPCATVASWGGGKPISLTFTRTLKQSDFFEHDVSVEPVAGDRALYSLLADSLPRLTLHVGGPIRAMRVISPPSDPSSSVMVTLNDTAQVRLTLNAIVNAVAQQMWTATTTIPTAETYQLPIPKAAAFGNQTFSLALSDAGAVTSVGYGNTAGAAAAFTAVGSMAGAIKPESTSDKASEVQAQANLIAQQQRLARCKANPAACT